ncbi:hypothetical protein [Thauera sp. Sel9]|uniref:hypothetical protein n=1 Tax=Thauera sp. Sel9 TaxID=2974299 RepID=UPI0021E11A79|nr:hypothetical protein [Thauera sp. Sel9]MCV2217665.1 hypothetical protein [Thauera sp. Sel9]
MSSDEVNRTMKAAQSIQSDTGFQEGYNRTVQAVRDGGSHWDSSSGDKASRTFGAQLNDTMRAEEQASTSFKRAQAYDEVNREMKSNGSGVDASLGAMYLEKYGSAATEALARMSTPEQAAALQAFSQGAAQDMAEKFLGGSGVQPITAEQKAVKGTVQSQTPEDVTATNAKVQVLGKHAQNDAGIPGNPNAAPVDRSSKEIQVIAANTENTVARETAKAQEKVAKKGGEVYDAYKQSAENASSPTSIFTGGTALGTVNGLFDLGVKFGLDGVSLEKMNRTDGPDQPGEALNSVFNRAKAWGSEE